MRSGLRRAGLVLASLLALGVAAGCGSSDKSSSSSGSSTTSKPAAAASDGAAKAKAAVAALSKTSGVKFPQPTEAFDPGHHKVMIISCGNAGINCLRMSQAAEKAATAIGWKASPIMDGKFTPATQGGYVQQAIQQGYDAIILVSMDTSTFKAAIDAAAAKKIPMACVQCVGSPPDKVTDVTTGGTKEGEAIGTYVASTLPDKGNILMFTDSAFPIVTLRTKGAEAKIKEYCPACTVKVEPFPTTDLAKPGPPTFTAALAANPKSSLDYVVTGYDPMAVPMLKTAQQQSRTDFKMTGYDGTKDFTSSIVSGDQAVADTSTPAPYAAWASMDIVARKLAGKDVWTGTGELPLALITPDNADQFQQGEGYFEPSDFDYKSILKKLWGR
jgi:ribose transport system substrate-binding protein